MNDSRKDIIKVEDYDISKLIPYEYNAKIHSPEQVAHIAESIKTFGFVQPIIADPGGVLIVGHGRLEAAKLLGMEKVPVWFMQNYSDAELQALRLADNKLNSDTGFDLEKLQFAIEEIAESGEDLLSRLNLNFDFSTLFPKERETDVDGTKGALSTFENNTVKQIVLLFESPVFDKVVARLDLIREKNPLLKNNTEIFLSLLEHYENAKAA